MPSTYELLLFLHVVLFVYWLGPDWGVYVMAPRIWNTEASVAERRRWAVTLVNLSQISRNSLILLIPVGVHLSWELGATVLPPWGIAVVWLAGLAWVGVSLTMHRNRGKPLGDAMTRVDQSMRYVMIPTLIAVALGTFLYDVPFNQNWIGAKLLVFSFLLFNSIQQRRIALLWVGALGDVAAAQTPDAADQQTPCSAPEYRQFDFWLGDWDVFNPDGDLVGTNSIRRIYGGCALEERWQSAGQHSGASFNIYNVQRKQWHQTWVDSGGLLLQLDGSFNDGKMVLSGETMGRNGARVLNRITWESTGPGRVRQLWESSTDGGTTWSVAFDGTYVRQGQ